MLLESLFIFLSLCSQRLSSYQVEMNTTDHQSEDCNVLDIYAPGESPVSRLFLTVTLVHCYGVLVFGTLGNALALWCVGTCAKTRRPVKVMLFSVFLPALVVCLVTRPVIGEIRIALLTCDPQRISVTVVQINMVVYNILAQIELTTIAAVAVVRAVSVWAPQRQALGLRGTVALVTAICVYSTLTGLGVLVMVVTDEMDHLRILVTVLFFINTTLPALITAAAYILMIYKIQRNKRRLAASQQQGRETTTMDQATRAMLAVFISNMVFGLPHSIYHLMGRQPHFMNILFHVLFSTHFVMDPLAFVWFNSCYRRRVFSRMKKVTRSISSVPTSSFLHASSVSPSDHHHDSNPKEENA
ncbi:uncharacterized protein LOC123508583 [Portunus trituberculatus]|uniref:uncharacterized protein LOC123508583 n=1 Tax=Portunus trituberculatus TaxID=210409 RepID=UPI001E1CDD1C|nr:uncharacterized protein LOC123508583 [Portunus trituberculatus]